MNPGFMIITSVNKASSAGRANFSPAIKHRCSNISGPSLSNYQVEDFTRIMVNWCEKNPSLNQENLNLKVITKIAENFKKLVAKNPKVNLRGLKEKFNKIAKRFKSLTTNEISSGSSAIYISNKPHGPSPIYISNKPPIQRLSSKNSILRS